MEKLVIVGMGGAGYTAAIYAARYSLSPTVIGLEDGGMIVGNHMVENFSGYADSVGGYEIMANMRKQAEQFDTKIINDKVTEITPIDENDFSKGYNVKTSMNGEIQTKMLILGTGTYKIKLNANREKEMFGKGVSYCATCDGFFYRGKTTVVVGGGDTAMIETLYLSDICEKVYLIHRRDEFRGEPIWLERIKAKENIEIITPAVVEEVLGEEKMTGLKLSVGEGAKAYADCETKNERIIDADGMFVAIGTKPNPVPGLDGIMKRDDGEYIIVDQHQATNLPGVFSAGDCTTASAKFRQLIVACSEGAVAAEGSFQYYSKNFGE